MAEIEQRNLISTIEECLKEHAVTLTDGRYNETFYLIESFMQGSGAKDFQDTYPHATKFQLDLAQKVFGTDARQTYGVLIGTGLDYRFAFNRKFADLNEDRNKLVFSKPEEVLCDALDLPASEGDDASDYIEINPSSSSGGSFRYSLKGKKEADATGKIRFRKASMLDRVAQSISQNQVTLSDLGRDFYLMDVSYQTPLLSDFLRTYEGELDPFKVQLAEKAFGNVSRKTKNNYSVLISPELEMQFAYNTLFAKHDPKTNKLVFKSAEDVLLASQLPVFPKPVMITIPRQSSGGAIRYSLVGKK